MTSIWRRSWTRTQNRLILLLGNTPEGRSAILASMIRRDPREATSYWLQLVVSVGIATLGLVVGSSAVVIGAMLVAPLMGPIIGLAMGLAAGSPFLVIRSTGRIGLSVAFAATGAALITLLLPFHEMNAEITARTSPTVLDLILAAFCALAGVYAALRPGADATTTAAGTSIGISLVPPLCASGYSLGTGAWASAGGAALLFLTNLVAIVVVGGMAFALVGFTQIDVVALEKTELGAGADGAPVARGITRRLEALFASRFGPWARFLMPFVLLAVVYVPLRRALDEVAWQVTVRAAVQHAITQEPLRIVDTRVRVERHEVEVVLVVVGEAAEASAARARLDAEIRQVSGVAPVIDVLAVPDATAFAGLESTLRAPHIVAATAPPPPPPPSPDEMLDASRTRIREIVQALWPSGAAGNAVAVELGTLESTPLHVRVVHLGTPLGRAGVEGLERAIAAELGRQIELDDVDVPSSELTLERGRLALVAAVARGVRATAHVEGVCVRVTRPDAPAPAPGPRARATTLDAELGVALDAELAQHPRVTQSAGSAWSVRFLEGSCGSPTPPAAAPPATGATPTPPSAPAAGTSTSTSAG